MSNISTYFSYKYYLFLITFLHSIVLSEILISSYLEPPTSPHIHINTRIGHYYLGGRSFLLLLSSIWTNWHYGGSLALPPSLIHLAGDLFRSDMGVWNFSQWNISRCDMGNRPMEEPTYGWNLFTFLAIRITVSKEGLLLQPRMRLRMKSFYMIKK